MALQILRVTENVWCLRRPSYFACSYLVRDANGLVAVDAGMDSSAQDVLTGLSQIQQPPESLQAILLTHWHNDHAAGAAWLKERFRIPVHYSEGDAPYFTRAASARGLRAWLGDKIPEIGVLVLLRGLLEEGPPRAVQADSFAREDASILANFQVVPSPGHTPGHVAYFHAPTRALFCGDAMAVIHGQLRFMARPVTLDLPAARLSMLRCLALNPAFICPGHREPLTANVSGEIERMRSLLNSSSDWPLLG